MSPKAVVHQLHFLASYSQRGLLNMGLAKDIKTKVTGLREYFWRALNTNTPHSSPLPPSCPGDHVMLQVEGPSRDKKDKETFKGSGAERQKEPESLTALWN